MYWGTLPGATGLALSVYLLGLPAYRAFVREEEVWAQAGFALYFFFVPIVFVVFSIALAAGIFCLATQEYRYVPAAIAVVSSASFLVLGIVLTLLFGLLS